MNSIESRLASVERQLKFQRLAIVGLLISVVALVGYGATEEVPEVIRARSFEVVNAKGIATVKLSSISFIESGKIEVFTDKGQRAVAITAVVFSGNVCSFYYDSDKPIAYHACLSGDRITLTRRDTGDPEHKLQTLAAIEARDGGGAITAFNEQERPVIYAGTNLLGGGVLRVSNKEGKGVIYAGSSADGHGLLTVSNKEGKGGVQVYGMGKGGGGGGVISF